MRRYSVKAAPMENTLRNSGIELIGDVPWGTHLCQFYKTVDDLLRLLVPYFKAGLEGNEFCMWVTSDPLTVQEAERALREAVPGYDRIKADGQIEIIPHTEWYLKDGYFDLRRVFKGWIGKLGSALERGFEGLRATGNTAWLEEEGWESFTQYEEELNEIIGDYNMMAICTYSLDKCGASEVIDVVKNHQYALIERDGEWELIESSERRMARETLRAREELYRRVVENIHDAVVVTDADFNITAFNKAASNIYGHSAVEVIGSNVTDVLGTEYVSSSREESLADMAQKGFFRGEVSQRHKDGTRIYIESIVIPLRKAEGGIDGYVGVNRDITARKRAEEAMRVLSDELLKANRELDSYARAVSHDLRGPLSAASLANALLKDSTSDADFDSLRAEVEESVEVVQRNIDKCHDLVDDLLALAEAGQEPVRVTDVDIAAVVGDILGEKESEFMERNCEVLVGDNLSTLHANETQMYQLFSNLIANALRHNDSDAPVVEILRLDSVEQGAHRFLVKDNGSGIPAEYFDDIFRPFFKRGKCSDTGIGLSIVKKVVEAYNGEIKAYNDGGACFEFEIHEA